MIEMAIIIEIAPISSTTAQLMSQTHLVLPVSTDGVTSAVLVGSGILTMTLRAKRVGSNCKP